MAEYDLDALRARLQERTLPDFVRETSPRLVRELPEPFYSTEYGAAYAGDALHLTKLVEDKSVDLILTSPPFALTRKKEYGNVAADEYVDWFMQFAAEFKKVLKRQGHLPRGAPRT